VRKKLILVKVLKYQKNYSSTRPNFNTTIISNSGLINSSYNNFLNKNFYNTLSCYKRINSIFNLNQRFYTTISSKDLKPWFLTGFTDAESYFNIIITKSPSCKIGWRVQARFIIEIHIKDITILKMIQDYFGGIGTITINPKKNSARYIIVRFTDINNIIVPHFNSYPLQSAKKIDFELWKECINIISINKHTTQEGLEQIIKNKSAMNLGLSNQLMVEFPNVTPLIKPSFITNDKKLNPDWVSGFTEGDGSFFVRINSTTNHIRPVMSIGLNIREKPLLEKIQEFFEGISYIYTSTSNNYVEWKIGKLSFFKKVILHFNTYSLIGLKSYNFIIWREIISLIETKAHLTPEGLEKIKSLKDQLNKWD
jgi:hypothetical protein